MSPHHDDKEGVCRPNANPAESVPAVHDFVAVASLQRQLLAELRTSWQEADSIQADVGWLPPRECEPASQSRSALRPGAAAER